MHFSFYYRRLLFCMLGLQTVCLPLAAQNSAGEDLLKKVHTKYYKAPCKCYSFSQRNKHYRNDSLIRQSEWHEVIEFPDKFRIDFGNKTDGNFVIFKNDSVFRYRKGVFANTRRDSNSLLLILGGMFYRNFENVLQRLKQAGYNTNVLSNQIWNNQPVYVLGATEGDTKSNQIWIDVKTLRVLRILENINSEEQMDMRFEAHQAWCKGYVETKVSFKRNGKLEQEEEYFNIKVEEKFPAMIGNN